MAKATKKATKTTAKATKAAPKVKTLNSCLCGCGAQVPRLFQQGHDAKLRGMLLRAEVKSPNAGQLAFAKSHGVTIGANVKVPKAAKAKAAPKAKATPKAKVAPKAKTTTTRRPTVHGIPVTQVAAGSTPAAA